MKKILITIFFVSIIGIVILYFYSENKSVSELFYAIDSHYSFIYEEKRRYNIDIYSDSNNSIIEYENENIYQIINNNDIYTLANPKINKSKINNYYIYQLSFDIFDIGSDSLLLENANVKIINQKFELELPIGDIYIIKPDNYELLNINNYYSSYSYLNDSLNLIGLNIEFNNSYNSLIELNVGKYGKARLDLALKNTLLANEINIKKIIPSYEYNVINNDYLLMDQNIYFIPISYENLKIIKAAFVTLNIDNANYYIDYFPFIANILDLNDYKNYMKEGIIKYV